MLTIRCGVAQENQSTAQDCDWPVLQSKLNPSFSTEGFLQTLSQPNELHIFASPTAFNFFVKLWNSLEPAQKKSLSHLELFACGVGNTTDDAARSLRESGVLLRWSVPTLASKELRENGLNWTLENLEKKGLIPKHPLHLWTKTWSTSDKILREVQNARGWNSWSAQTHEIYSLDADSHSIPTEVVHAIVTKTPLCFGVKSAEVLDAVLAVLLEHTHVSTPSQLPRSIQFSVWEKGALQRAQQLFLQTRLIPWAEFESQVAKKTE